MADNEALGVLLSKIVVDLADMKKNLSEGRREMQSFKTMAADVGASVKKALMFAGVAVGIYEIASALKSFAKEAALVGARTETLNIAMQQVGKTYGVSAQSLKFYVDELKTAGITTQESMTAVTKALTTGIPLDQLKDLATRARDIAVVAGVNTSEALNRIMQGIITGEQETLRRMMIQVGSWDDIYKRYAATLGKTAEALNSVEKSQARLNEVLRLTAGFAGTGAAADESVGKQLQSMARFAEEARNALWALFSPVMTAAVQEMTQSWKDLKTWADANQVALKAWGNTIGSWVTSIADATRAVVNFIREHQTLIKTVLEIAIFAKASGWVIGFGKSLAGVMPKIAAATSAIIGLKIACSGPWGIVITVAIGGVLYGINKIREMHNELAALQKDAGISGRGPLSKPGDIFKVKQIPGISARGVLSPELAAKLQDEAATAQKSREEAEAAHKKAQEEAAKLGGDKAKTGGKGAAKEVADNLLAPMLAMFKTKREAELQEAQNSFDLLKSTNDKKRAELEKSLAEELIDGQTYYQRLQDLQQQETAAALKMIERKKAAQTAAYQESITEMEASEKMSEEAKSIARQKMAAENQKTLSKLALEGAQARLEGEIQVTNELRRQVEVRRQYADITTGLQIDTAQLLGAISDQEATLQRLNLEWKQNKEAALKVMSPDDPFFAAGERKLAAQQSQVLYGDYASQITQGISSLADTLMQGGQDLKKTANSMFKGLFDAALKPGLEQLKNLLVNGFKELFGEAGAGIAGAVMGAIGLIGMLLTSGGGSKSWSPSGVQGGVTTHEAVRGVIAGESSIPIAQIGVSLQDALVPTNSILSQIEGHLRGGLGSGGGGGTLNVNVTGPGFREALEEFLGQYFSKTLMQGA